MSTLAVELPRGLDSRRLFPGIDTVRMAAALLVSERVPERVAPPVSLHDLWYADVAHRASPSSMLVGSITSRAGVEVVEGPRWRVEVSPGVLAVRNTDPVRRERTVERQRARDEAWREQVRSVRETCALLATGRDCDGVNCPTCSPWVGEREGGVSRISAWSPKSRSKMVERLGQLDYTPLFQDEDGRPLVPAMVTLTYPGDWLAVAPASSVVRRHVELLRKRWLKKWGRPMVGIWKREFQRRGAPHLHFLIVPPADPGFPRWLSIAWAEIVDAEWCGSCCGGGSCCEFGRHVLAGTGIDYHEGARALDPKRLGIYFAKHGSYSEKEYQNAAPREWLHDASCDDLACVGCSGEGIGRFWGIWGLKRAVVAVEVEPETAATVRSVMRHYSKATRYYVPSPVWRKVTTVDRETGEIGWKWRRRTSSRPVQHCAGRSGFLLLNDAPGFLAAMTRLLDRQHRFQAAHRLSDGRVWKSGAGLGPVGFLP